MKAFPWDEAMRFGFGVLGLSSREFWGLTPRELAAAFEARAGRARGVVPGREMLGRLMAAFPDEVT
ncbi:phage tail assembly chaperone [Devosia sp. ZB163]|uniref:phage tail assembly chaperone n=1 Tax=Devosia sp. ZB163 TaxID=3025938 RepID=UPI002362E913|nr:phage tail assembly chaperone [Devosia sp. ZB163]MDC9823827.1 phage tail assembly chaperone [Devosia sp. ZB163]